MAIDEKYIPISIKNLRYAAYLIFFILLILAGKLILIIEFSCLLCYLD